MLPDIPGPPDHPRPCVLPPEHALSCWRMAQPDAGDLTYATVGFVLRADWFDTGWYHVTPEGGRVLGTIPAALDVEAVVVSLTCDPAVAREWERLLRGGVVPQIVQPGVFSEPDGVTLVTLNLDRKESK